MMTKYFSLLLSKKLKRKFENDLDVYVLRRKKYVHVVFDRLFISLGHLKKSKKLKLKRNKDMRLFF